MNYILIPSLEHIALINTAFTVWNQDDIRALVAKSFIEGTFRSWKRVEGEVIEKVQELPLPQSIKKKVLGFIKPIGLEIRDGRVLPESRCIRLIEKSLNMLCWTPQGTIDKKKIAEALIRDENLNIQEHYRLACKNCLKDDILRLWKEMPESCRKFFYSTEDPRHVQECLLVKFWTYNMKGEVIRWLNYMIRENRGNPLYTPYQHAFEYAISKGNKVATEYFLQELTPGEREESLERAIIRGEKNVFIFLLSKINEEQQIDVFEKYPLKALVYLLDWPWQGFFVETAKHVLDFLSKEHFYLLLQHILVKVEDGFMDYNYQKLFGEFWQQSPLTHKEFVINECIHGGSLLFNLFEIKDKENIKLILKSATSSDREKIIFSSTGKFTFVKLIDEIELLEFFVQECISSKDLMIKFREELIQHALLMHYSSKEKQEKEKRKFIQVLNDLTQKYDKRRDAEEGTWDLAKRFCS